jgi:hypothetical protein
LFKKLLTVKTTGRIVHGKTLPCGRSPRTMLGVSVDAQLSIGPVLRQDERIDSWNHDVARAVNHESGLLDGLKFREALAVSLSRFPECCGVSLCRLE